MTKTNTHLASCFLPGLYRRECVLRTFGAASTAGPGTLGTATLASCVFECSLSPSAPLAEGLVLVG